MTAIRTLAAALVLAGTTIAAETYTIDRDKSEVAFTILNKPPGATEPEKVPGKFKDFSGKIVFDAEAPANSQVEIEIKSASVDTANEKRDAHLRNQDFFKVKEFPIMTFKSTAVKKLAEDKFEVTGDFTLLGQTKPVTAVFDLTDETSGKAAFQIKRSDYGMSYRVPDTGDEVDVMLTVVGKPQ
ncbi:YceI family protein [soil metagenome]